MVTASHVVLRGDDVSVVLAVPEQGLPYVLHWGADLGDLTAADLTTLQAVSVPGVPHSSTDVPRVFSLAPGPDDGWQGTPAMELHRGPRVIYPRFADVQVLATDCGVAVTASDDTAGIALSIELEITGSVLRMRISVTNCVDGDVWVGGVRALMPLPDTATELLDLTGRHCRERTPQRREFLHGSVVRASRRGRTGHDATLIMAAGSAGFGFQTGQVWQTHVAFSGDHLHLAERFPERAGQAAGVIGGGELLAPGEISLACGETYSTPWVHFVYSAHGLDGTAQATHRWLRARRNHPRTPRPVVLNTWEGVYFDHDLTRLRALADTAAQVGVERFVLDDGWFRHRRDDTAGLGDWFVDPDVWPHGLAPLFDHVRALGMSPGLWVEPEMVNPDSDLARAHPEWILGSPGRTPLPWRHQQVLDLTRPEVFDHLLHRLDAIVSTERPDYLKWDHNRDLLAAVAHDGRAGVHQHTLAVYRLLDELTARHPGLEIESCASGGGRIDLEMLDHTARVWGSDTNDPLERQQVNRWTMQLIPPELLGSHVGPAVSHTTGRRATLRFRCLTALFAHAGLELDVTELDSSERDLIRAFTAAYRELRAMLHTGQVVRADHPDPSVWVHGVVAQDSSSAVFAVIKIDTCAEDRSDRVRLPGLDADRRYRVRVDPDLSDPGHGIAAPPWVGDGVELTGSMLANAGVAVPVLFPETGILLRVDSV
ncbi:alpha-galactosidase [Williamsia sp. CHRR-6]|nr:alpha-galactosidase [Williamsia sp. CHRR-6]